MTIPAMTLKTFELVKKNCPTNVAVDPNAINTKENPKVKKNCFNNYQISFFFIYSFK